MSKKITYIEATSVFLDLGENHFQNTCTTLALSQLSAGLAPWNKRIVKSIESDKYHNEVTQLIPSCFKDHQRLLGVWLQCCCLCHHMEFCSVQISWRVLDDRGLMAKNIGLLGSRIIFWWWAMWPCTSVFWPPFVSDLEILAECS